MKAAREIPTAFPLSCGKDDMLETVADKMFLSDAHFLTVIDEKRKVVGTITYLDVCMAPGKKDKLKKDLRVFEIMNPK